MVATSDSGVNIYIYIHTYRYRIIRKHYGNI